MNAEKAKEHFSAYFEGTLDAGLRQQFERTLAANTELNKEYTAFAEVMRQLDALQAPVPEAPFDLHERITRKLDLHVHEQKAKQKPALFGWLRTFGIASVAILAIWGASTQLGKSGNASSANVGPEITSSSQPLKIEAESTSSVRLTYKATGSQNVTVYNEDGSVLRNSQNQNLDMPVNNLNPETVLFTVKSDDENVVRMIALPGSNPEKPTMTEGKLAEMAKAIASYYKVPVVIETPDVDMMVKWSYESKDALGAVSEAFHNSRYTSAQKAHGLISIEKN